MPTVQEILAETTSFINAKQASFDAVKTKSALAGTDPGSMPGAEHDKPAPAEHGNPDPEVDDGTQGPKGSHNPDNVGGKDDSPVTRGHAVDAEESVDEPAKKPLVTSDAEAKTAAMCNDLLAEINRYRQDAAAQAKSATTKPAAKPAAKPAEKPATSEKGAAAKPVAETEEAAKTAKTGGFDLELTSEFLQKIAAIILSTEEGTEFVDTQLRKHAGAEAARSLMSFIAEQNEEAEKLAAAQQGAADANALIDDLTYRAGFEAGHAGAAKSAAATQGAMDARAIIAESLGQHQQGMATKLGQEVADASIADLMGQAGPEMAVSPEELEAAGGGMPEGAMPEDGGEEFTEEDIVGALEMLVEEGELDPQDAQAILDNISGGAGAPGEGDPEAAEGEDEGAEPAGDELVPEGTGE